MSLIPSFRANLGKMITVLLLGVSSSGVVAANAPSCGDLGREVRRNIDQHSTAYYYSDWQPSRALCLRQIIGPDLQSDINNYCSARAKRRIKNRVGRYCRNF